MDKYVRPPLSRGMAVMNSWSCPTPLPSKEAVDELVSKLFRAPPCLAVQYTQC